MQTSSTSKWNEIWKRKHARGDFVNFATTNLLTQYNNREHGTIKAAPNKVWRGQAKNKQQVKKLTYSFNVGDFVRKIERNAIFEKGAFQWSSEVYKVIAAQDTPQKYKYPDADPGTRPRAFVLETTRGKRRHLERSYLGYELLKVREKVERDDGVGQREVDNRRRREQRQDKQDRQARRLLREGIETGNIRPDSRRAVRGRLLRTQKDSS